ncbi:MAG: 4Fe-4S dicluster domain-containing protein [candidate division Zixibacteria bacterium]|nr:4Fe-4S dicluster domain-containing protein [candidate division Zixibacteria bacterium]
MKAADFKKRPKFVTLRNDLNKIVEVLSLKSYEIIGPIVSENAVVYDAISSLDELPIGFHDQQDNASYRLTKSDDKSLFGYASSPHSWKKYLYPPVQKLWEARKTKSGFEIIKNNEEVPKRAFIGVRSCELNAIAIHDKIFLDGPYADPSYKKRRDNVFIIAVNCTHPSGTCFCVSMNTGPKAITGFDLALTEVIEKGRHYFVVEVGSEAGAEILKEVPCNPAGDKEIEAADKKVENASNNMGRKLNAAGIKNLLQRNFENPYWEKIAARCLTCGNCTMVCPTCFCTTIEDTTDLSGQIAQRRRVWDSCFTLDFSYIAGGSIRISPMSRYRQWMMHKLAAWHDQFGMSGCVGCGRCITWCPAGIDITEEASIIEESEINK